MAFDAELQIDSSVLVDTDVASPQVNTAFILGRRGFPDHARFTVAIELPSAAPTGDIGTVKFVLQVSTDEGGTWFDYATIQLDDDQPSTGVAAVSQKRVYSVPIGLGDFRDEILDTDGLQVRTSVSYTAEGGGDEADDFTFSSYLTGPNNYPVNNHGYAT